MNVVFLRLEGPLQAWGLRARWEERDTASEPTKSGVIGLIGCAMGVRRGNDRLRTLSEELRMGVRVDQQGDLLVDYHTTGGGFYQATEYRGGARYHDEPYIGGVLSAEPPKNGRRYRVKLNATTNWPETDVSYRRYLMDASFLVALGGPEGTLAAIAAALNDPVWPVFLGRKSCPPSVPVYAGSGDFDSLEAALHAQPLPERVVPVQPTDEPVRLRFVVECAPGEGNARNDEIGEPAHRLFWPRYVREWFEVFGENAAPLSINTLEG
jgi:CRISPR system Cascade subunit CasD